MIQAGLKVPELPESSLAVTSRSCNCFYSLVYPQHRVGSQLNLLTEETLIRLPCCEWFIFTITLTGFTVTMETLLSMSQKKLPESSN